MKRMGLTPESIVPEPVLPSGLRGHGPVLIPSCGALVALEAVTLLLPEPWTAAFGVVAAIVVMSVVLLRIGSHFTTPQLMARSDRTISRWSGILAPLPLFVFLGTAYGLESRGVNVNTTSPFGWLLMAALMEWGFLLSAVAVRVPRSLRPLPPALLWRLTSMPLLLIYGLYLLGTLSRGFGEMSH